MLSKEKIISFSFAAVVAFIVTFCVKMLFLNDYEREITGKTYNKAVHDIPKAEAVVKVVKEPTAQVLMSKVAIKKGTVLTANLVEWRDWPKSILSKNYIATEKGKSINTNLSVDAFMGLKACINIDQALPLTESMFFKKNEISDSDKDIKVRGGMRAFTVAANQTSVSNQMFFPGDIVDVYISTIKIFYRNVKILAIDDKGSIEEVTKAIELAEKKAEESGKKPNKDSPVDLQRKRYLPKTVTLELTPEQIGQIVPNIPAGGLVLILISDIERREYMQKFSDEYIEEVQKEENYEISNGIQSYSASKSGAGMELVGALETIPEEGNIVENASLQKEAENEKYTINVVKRDKATVVEVPNAEDNERK